MHGKGVINIKGNSGPKWVEITVSDSGPGIPPELHDRIFELNYSGRAQYPSGKTGLWTVVGKNIYDPSGRFNQC